MENPARPAVKLPLLGVVKTGREPTAKLNGCEAVPAGLDADRINGKVPDAVAVPVITPVMGSRVRPAGSEPTVIS